MSEKVINIDLAHQTYVRSYSDSDQETDITVCLKGANRDQNALQQNCGLFDHLVGAGEQRRRHAKAESLRRGQVDDEIEFRRLLDGDIGRFRSAQNLIDQLGGAPVQVRVVWPIRHQSPSLNVL